MGNYEQLSFPCGFCGNSLEWERNIKTNKILPVNHCWCRDHKTLEEKIKKWMDDHQDRGNYSLKEVMKSGYYETFGKENDEDNEEKYFCANCDCEVDDNQYYENLDGHYCDDCANNYDCEDCENYLRSTEEYTINGEKIRLCEDCYHNHVCEKCDKLDNLKEITTNGENFLVCEECYNKIKAEEETPTIPIAITELVNSILTPTPEPIIEQPPEFPPF